MKTRTSTRAIALATFMGASLLFAGPLDKAWMKGTTDKDPLSYKPGEEMVFTVAPQNIRGDIPKGTYFLKWERTGDDGVSEKGSEPLTGKPFVEWLTAVEGGKTYDLYLTEPGILEGEKSLGGTDHTVEGLAIGTPTGLYRTLTLLEVNEQGTLVTTQHLTAVVGFELGDMCLY